LLILRNLVNLSTLLEHVRINVEELRKVELDMLFDLHHK